MAQLAIKGHATRGKEIIEILEMLGGKNTHDYICNMPDFAYSINEQGIIEWFISHPNSIYTIFTLEEFLERFPYKVGDRVKVCGDNLGIIIGMRWESGRVVYKVKLTKNGYETSKTSENLQPYEEIPTYLNRKVNEQAEKIKEILKPVKEIIEERKYSELRTPLDDDDKLATEATIDGNKITPPENYLIGKVTKVDNGMLVEFVKKQLQYPKTYEECCKIIDYYLKGITIIGHKVSLLENFQKLFVCRDADWKIAGEQMGLGKPWKPDWEKADERKYCIVNTEGNVAKWVQKTTNKILAFPTEEMRDAFYENFKELIELCKELL